MSEQKHTPGPWFENGEWVVEPKNLLSNEADANLIAAAPELLAACHKALEMRAMLSVASNTLGVWEERIEASKKVIILADEIRAAIARAEGKE